MGFSSMFLFVWVCVRRHTQKDRLSCLSSKCAYTAAFSVTSRPSCVHARIHITSTLSDRSFPFTGGSLSQRTLYLLFVTSLKCFLRSVPWGGGAGSESMNVSKSCFVKLLPLKADLLIQAVNENACFSPPLDEAAVSLLSFFLGHPVLIEAVIMGIHISFQTFKGTIK